MENNQATPPQKRIHIYEIDLIRAITVFSVVAIHALAFTNTLIKSKTGFLWLNIFGHTLHYNREMFVFVTGLVLTYVYFNKPFSVKKFWFKRFTFVLIPYILWSIFYVVYNHPQPGILQYIQLTSWDIVTGEASFQLYYILLTLQFYALFPLFLLALRKIAKYPWQTLAVSLIVQLAFIYIDFHFLQTPVSHPPQWHKTLLKYQDRIFLFYQFYFVLGAFAGVYLNALQKAIKKYGKYLLLLFVGTTTLYIIYSYVQLFSWHEHLNYATSVLQPSVVLYSTVVILFFSYLSILWEKRKSFYTIIKVIAETSFGIYFVHVLALSLITNYLLTLVPATVPAVIKIIAVLLIAFSASVIFCWLLLKTPWLSWTIGRSQRIKLPFKIQVPKRAAAIISLIAVLFFVLCTSVLIDSIHTYYTQKKLPRTNQQKEEELSKHAFSFQNNPASDSAAIIINQPVNSTGCGKALTLQTGTGTNVGIISGGLHRIYRIYLPKAYVNKVKHPLVISFHGYASNAQKQERITRFDPIANRNNIIVAYPQGTPDKDGLLGWNTGLHKNITAKDVLFVSNMLNQIQSNLCVNPTKIYATGFSNGGGFVNTLALRLSGRIAAFAPVSGSYVSPFTKITRGVPIIEFHGTRDKTVPYDGNPKHNEFAVNTWIDDWLHKDKCHTKPHTIYKSNKAVGYEWSDCSNNASIVHYELLGERHIWPISLFKQKDDKTIKYVTASSLIWQFFKQHPLNVHIKTVASK